MSLKASCFWVLLALTWLTAQSPLSASPEADIPPIRPLPAGAALVSVDEAEAYIEIDKEMRIIDVRSKEEILEQGQLAKAKHLDAMRGDFSEHFKEIAGDTDNSLLIYCALGGRSQRAAEQAAALGYTDIKILKGGFDAWKKAGKPIIK